MESPTNQLFVKLLAKSVLMVILYATKIIVMLLHRTKTNPSWLCIHAVYVNVQEERSGALWPRTALWEGEEGTGRRSRTVQLGDLLGPSTGYDSALESQHQLCAMSPGTEEKQKTKKKLKYVKELVNLANTYIITWIGSSLCGACNTGSIFPHQIWQQPDARLWP